MTGKSTESKASRQTGTIVALLIALALGGTVAFNVVAIAAAYRTDSGMVTEDYYQKSLIKDPEDTRREQFTALDWSAALQGPGPDRKVRLTLRDAAGAPLAGAAVASVFFRTTQAGFDKTTALTEVDPGVYAATVSGLAPGRYQARFRIRRGRLDAAWHRPVLVPAAGAR